MLERLIPPFPPDLLKPPRYSEEDKASQAENFHKVAWGIILVATPLIVSVALFQPQLRPHAAAVIVSVDVLCLGLLELNRRGWTRLASGLLIGGLILRLGLNALQQGGIRSPGISMFLVLVLIAGLLLGEQGTLLTALACSLAALGLTLSETFGILPAQTVVFNAVALLALNILYMGVVIVVARLSVETIRKALRRAQVELVERERAEQRLQLALAAGQIGIWELESERGVFVGSDRAFTLRGLPVPESREISVDAWFKPVHPEDLAPVSGELRRLSGGGEDVHANYRIVRPDGEVRFIESFGSSLKEHEGRPARLVGTVMDVTERMQAQKRLAENEARYRNVVETSEEAIVTLDEDRRITFVNPKFCALTGYRSDELLGRSADDFQFPEDLPGILARREQRRRSGRAQTWDQTIRRKDGSAVAVLASTSDFRGEDGAFAGTVLMMTDLTARNQLQADLLQAQKIEAMGRLSGGVAHDFNNLLTAILGFSQLVKESLAPGDPNREDLQQVIDTSMRAAALTRQLLAFSRKQVMQPVVLEVNAVVGDMEKMLQRIIGEDIALGTKLDLALGCCRADRGQIEQVILNLVVNARDAMPKGGAITVSTANAVLDAGETETPGPFIRVEVADTGEGMSEETQRRIFEPFFTTKPAGKGTGLGLATVHGIVKQSGGVLKVRSKLGAGTAFEVLLPCVPRPEEKAAETTKAAVRAGHETVLFLDDDAAIRRIACRLLTSAGYRVLEAEGGTAGLELLERESIDLLITDVVMSGMSGFDLAAKARARRPGLRVLIISGYLDRDQPGGADAAEFAYLQKPFSSEALNAKVREILDAREQS